MANPTAQAIHPLRVTAPDLMAWIEDKDPVAIDSWRDMGADEYGRAFTAARTAGYDVVDDLYYALVDTIGAQGTDVDYAAAVIPTLQRKGWLGGDAQAIGHRVRLIYRQNMRMARAAGRWQRIQRNKAVFPYLRAVTVRDPRVRHPPKSPHSDHRAWDGIILEVDHPFWTRWFPPMGFNCRCSTIQMSRSDLLKWPTGITTELDLAEREKALGEPIFATPARGVPRQLEEMAEATNAERIGQPPINAQTERGKGATVFDAILSNLAAQQVERVIAQLFGKAA